MKEFFVTFIICISLTLNLVWFLERRNSFESAPYVDVRVDYDTPVKWFETKAELNVAKRWKGAVWIAFVNQSEARVTVMEK